MFYQLGGNDCQVGENCSQENVFLFKLTPYTDRQMKSLPGPGRSLALNHFKYSDIGIIFSCQTTHIFRATQSKNSFFASLWHLEVNISIAERLVYHGTSICDLSICIIYAD